VLKAKSEPEARQNVVYSGLGQLSVQHRLVDNPEPPLGGGLAATGRNWLRNDRYIVVGVIEHPQKVENGCLIGIRNPYRACQHSFAQPPNQRASCDSHLDHLFHAPLTRLFPQYCFPTAHDFREGVRRRRGQRKWQLLSFEPIYFGMDDSQHPANVLGRHQTDEFTALVDGNSSNVCQ